MSHPASISRGVGTSRLVAAFAVLMSLSLLFAACGTNDPERGPGRLRRSGRLRRPRQSGARDQSRGLGRRHADGVGDGQ